MDAIQQQAIAQARSYLEVLRLEAQDLKQSLDECKAKLEGVEAALAQNGTDQAHAVQHIAELETQ